MKILLTGATGFIGSNIFKSLSNDHELYGLSRRKTDASNIINFDLLSTKSLELIGDEFDVIIHCAAKLATTNNHDDFDLFLDNIKITKTLLEMVKCIKPKLVINFSTIGVYPDKDGYYNENSEVKPSDSFEGLYNLSKFSSEELLSFYLNKTKTRLVNLRVGQTIGLGMRNDRIYAIMKEELEKKNIIKVFGNGERISAFLTIEFLIESINKIIDNKDIEGTYNLCEENISYLDLAKRIIKDFGNSNSKIIHLSQSSKAKVIIDNSNIKKYINV